MDTPYHNTYCEGIRLGVDPQGDPVDVVHNVHTVDTYSTVDRYGTSVHLYVAKNLRDQKMCTCAERVVLTVHVRSGQLYLG